jgi:hypothetical protein
MTAGEIRAEFDRPLTAGDRLVELKAVVAQHRQIVVAVHIVRGEAGGPAAGDERLIEPAQDAVDLADIAMIDRLHRCQGERALHQPHRLVDAVQPEGDDPHQMQRRGMVGGLGDFAQDAVGLGKAARLLVPGRDLHHLRDHWTPEAGGWAARVIRRRPACRRGRAELDPGTIAPPPPPGSVNGISQTFDDRFEDRGCRLSCFK